MKKRIKEIVLVKITKKMIKLKRENRAFKNKILNDAIYEQKVIDKISLLENDIRQLLLKLDEGDRELWLSERGKDYERYYDKKK